MRVDVATTPTSQAHRSSGAGGLFWGASGAGGNVRGFDEAGVDRMEEDEGFGGYEEDGGGGGGGQQQEADAQRNVEALLERCSHR